MADVREEVSPFDRAGSLLTGRHRYRQFGFDGPLYEVLSITGDKALIRVIDSGEELTYGVTRALADPPAD